MDLDVELRIVFDQLVDRYVVHQLLATRRGARRGRDGAGAQEAPECKTFIRRGLVGVIKIGRFEPQTRVGRSECRRKLDKCEAARIRAIGPSSSNALLWVARTYAVATA